MSDSKRDYSLDILRIIACMMVVGIHTSMEGWCDISPRIYSWTVLNFYDTVCRPAVPLFIMISATLFLYLILRRNDPEKDPGHEPFIVMTDL